MYRSYANTELINDWKQLITKTPEEIDTISNEWDEIRKYNKEIYKQETERISSLKYKIETFFRENNIPFCDMRIIGRSNRMFPNKKRVDHTWYKNMLKERCFIVNSPRENIDVSFYSGSKKTIDGMDIEINNSCYTLHDLYNEVKHVYDIQIKIQQKQKQIVYKSVEIAFQRNIDITGLTEKQIVDKIRNIELDDWVVENPTDNEYEEIEGNVVDGFWWG